MKVCRECKWMFYPQYLEGDDAYAKCRAPQLGRDPVSGSANTGNCRSLRSYGGSSSCGMDGSWFVSKKDVIILPSKMPRREVRSKLVTIWQAIVKWLGAPAR